MTRRSSTAALVALAALVVAIAWGAAVLVPLSGQIEDFARTDIPGEVSATLDAADTRVVYYERERWFATTPVNPPLDIEVTGPAGQPVPTAPHDAPVHYRLPGLVAEAVATFEADQPGDHTVAVEPAGSIPADARAAIGSDVAARALGGLVGPVLVLLIGMAAAAWIAARAAAAGRSR